MNNKYNEFLMKTVDQIGRAICEVGEIGYSDDFDLTPIIGKGDEIHKALRKLQCEVMEMIELQKNN